ncbi:hypothetical protein AVEN_118290-1 [Araneus ventricosus]|uniref:Uncharacterized protein n=1 Tax=Araneus ventricosus TaxID=182803 RepID=A0A4Y2QSY2_ARAVE|nr:hypothetical protein AVEN_246478-1 [Araneus ventricosus]GBN66360.1 hypothetical protein AVEN_118290-1 [Araneus ventricosus]
MKFLMLKKRKLLMLKGNETFHAKGNETIDAKGNETFDAKGNKPCIVVQKESCSNEMYEPCRGEENQTYKVKEIKKEMQTDHYILDRSHNQSSEDHKGIDSFDYSGFHDTNHDISIGQKFKQNSGLNPCQSDEEKFKKKSSKEFKFKSVRKS